MATTTQSTSAVAADGLLRKALAANAEFCMVSGLGMAVFSRQAGGWIGAPTAVVLIVGLSLIPWGALLWYFSRRDAIRRAEAWTALAGDEAWVIGTLILVLGFPTALNASGNAVAVLVALVVAVFAVLEFVGIRRMG